jgi:hypothetical protein
VAVIGLLDDDCPVAQVGVRQEFQQALQPLVHGIDERGIQVPRERRVLCLLPWSSDRTTITLGLSSPLAISADGTTLSKTRATRIEVCFIELI